MFEDQNAKERKKERKRERSTYSRIKCSTKKREKFSSRKNNFPPNSLGTASTSSRDWFPDLVRESPTPLAREVGGTQVRGSIGSTGSTGSTQSTVRNGVSLSRHTTLSPVTHEYGCRCER